MNTSTSHCSEGGSDAHGGFATTGTANAAVGAWSLYANTTGVNNAAVGAWSLYANTTGNYNAAVGFQTLAANTTGSSNAAFGYSSLSANTTGSGNAAVGFQTLYANTTGSSNGAFGSNSLTTNTTGSGNAAVGLNSLAANTIGNANAAVGAYSLNANTTGYANAAFGAYTLYSNTTGGNNVGLGLNAGAYNTTGSSNTFLGSGAAPDSLHGALSFATAVGAGAVVTQSNSLVLGGPNGSPSAVNVGIGTTTPAQKLSVAGTVESTTGGFKFPDGSVQTMAGTVGGLTGVTAGAGISVTGSAPSPTVSIATAGIVNAMIGSLAVANANIANVSASKITGSLPVAQVAGAATLGANTFVGTQTISGGSGTGVYGASSTGIGVEGSTASTTSYAGYFYNGGGSGTSRGVGVAAFTGNGSSSDTHPGGMYYKAAGEFSGPVGIIGATSPESTSGDAIHAVAGNASGLWALRATKSGGGDYAGYFIGNVFVIGNLGASGTKAFKIDHPLDPANQYLYHYAVESPEVQNMYKGTIRLDATGAAVVTLPDYFSAINTGDYCYSVTPIGAPMPNLHIAEEIKGNTFTIAGGVAGQKVSWLVYGQRSDAWLRDHPASDVVDKPPEERGTYVYPQAYGVPESRSLTAAHDQVLNHTPLPLVSPLTSTLPIMPTTSLPPAAVPGRLPSGGGAGGVR